MRLGLDTGGTCTDAALVDEAGRVAGSAKAATTHAHLLDGLRAAAIAALDDARARGSDVTLVSLSTTLATNALVERRGRPAGLVLVGARPAALSTGPLIEALGSDPAARVGGGHDAAGEPVAPLDAAALEAFAREHAARVEAWAVSSVFAVRNPAHELEAAALLRDLTSLPVTCGHELASSLDAPRRALTALLNARLVPAIGALIDAAHALVDELGIDAPLMVVRGDGSLIGAALARGRPVETILSGPAASVVGACALAGVDEALVVDTGGTTTDIVRVAGGRPRTSVDGATVGGHRTMVRAIEAFTLGLGGDSEVRLPAARTGVRTGAARSIGSRVALGPARVVPLSSLAGPEASPAARTTTLAALRDQLARGRPASRDGRFAVRLGGAAPVLPAALAELLDAVGGATGTEGAGGGPRAVHATPIALETLARRTGTGGALDRPLGRLEARGLVRRAGFTPTDALRVLEADGAGEADGAAAAARLGAALLAREARPEAGVPDAAAILGIARAVLRETSLRVAHACAAAALPRGTSDAAREARLDWLAELLDGAGGAGAEIGEGDGTASGTGSDLSLSVHLDVPIVGVGGPAHRHHPAAAAALRTRCVLPEHAAVANAVGAVAGTVREVRRVVLVADGNGGGGGADAFRVLLDSGPAPVPGLAAATALAEAAAVDAVRAAARAAGADAIEVSVERRDVAASRDGVRVLLERTVVAVAAGRPVMAAKAAPARTGGPPRGR